MSSFVRGEMPKATRSPTSYARSCDCPGELPIVLSRHEELGDRFQFQRLSSFEMHGYSTEKITVTYIVISASTEICGIIFKLCIIAKLKTAASTSDSRANLVRPNESMINRRLGRKDDEIEITCYQHSLVARFFFIF